jgi:hypothetical protein
MIRGGSRAGCIELPLARYRLQDGSLSSQRAPMLAGRLQTLAKARATQSLTPDELTVLDEAERRLRARLRRQRAVELLAARAPGRRRAALRAALWPGQHPLGRLKLAGAALMPDRTARRLATRPRETTGGLYAAPPGAAGGAPRDPAGPPR